MNVERRYDLRKRHFSILTPFSTSLSNTPTHTLPLSFSLSPSRSLSLSQSFLSFSSTMISVYLQMSFYLSRILRGFSSLHIFYSPTPLRINSYFVFLSFFLSFLCLPFSFSGKPRNFVHLQSVLEACYSQGVLNQSYDSRMPV